MGRKKRFEIRLTLPLPEAMVERIDALLAEGEPRLDLIRGAIEREVVRRERSPVAAVKNVIEARAAIGALTVRRRAKSPTKVE